MGDLLKKIATLNILLMRFNIGMYLHDAYYCRFQTSTNSIISKLARKLHFNTCITVLAGLYRWKHPKDTSSRADVNTTVLFGHRDQHLDLSRLSIENNFLPKSLLHRQTCNQSSNGILFPKV